jgi:hypothetical protein
MSDSDSDYADLSSDDEHLEGAMATEIILPILAPILGRQQSRQLDDANVESIMREVRLKLPGTAVEILQPQ